MNVPNLLVVNPGWDGQSILAAFGVDPALWRVVSFGSLLAGSRFERIVAMVSTIPSSSEGGMMIVVREYIEDVLRCRLTADGKLHLL